MTTMPNSECVFCKIIAGDLPTKIIYQDEKVIAFDDLHPKAPQHKLIVPRKHIATLNDIAENEKELLGHMMHVAKNLAIELAIAEKGYRVIMNCNEDGGQVVYHIHLHLVGGRPLKR